MTREEAIAELSVIWERLSHPEECENGCYSFRDGDYLEALDMAIEALSADTTATNTEKSSNCGDLISRADAIEAVHGACNYCDTCDLKDIGCSQIQALSALPSVDRPSGEWVRSGNTLICPICGAKGEDIKDDYCFNYCPNCGADMRNQNNEQR